MIIFQLFHIGIDSVKAMLNSRQHSSKEHKPPNQSSKTTKSPPAHMQAPCEPMQLPLDECMQTTSQNKPAASALLWPVRPVNGIDQTGAQHLNMG
jgi:hypothetical protein